MLARLRTTMRVTTLSLGWLALIIVLAVPRAVVARDAGFSSAVNTRVKAAKAVAPSLGVHVYDLGRDETAYSYQADIPRIIASNTKLVTSAAALDVLGPDYFFETPLLASGPVVGGTLEGDLAVIGGGDPNLSGRRYNGDSFGAFREWASALRGRGVHRVAGDLVLVHGRFADATVHPDWPVDQRTRWYEAPVSALSFNDNCVLVRVWPSPAVGRSPAVEMVPALDLFAVENTAQTTGRRAGRIVIDRRPAGHVLTIRGETSPRRRAVDKWVAVEDPVAYFGAAMRAALAEEGIAVTGAVRPVDSLPVGDWSTAYVHRSDLLSTLEVVNKRSQNFFAESVLKTLGAERCGEGTWAAGVRVATEFLSGLGLPPEAYTMADGSGMSRNNRFTPRQLTTVLAHMRGHRWASEFMRTLPHSGESGLRWEKRLADGPYRGNVLAKTGTLNGVSTLSGYAKARSGRLYAFSILLNNSRGGDAARRVQDGIVRAVIDHG